MENHNRPIHVLTEIESAQLIAKIAHGLLTGPCAVAFMRQTALQQGAELMAGPLMEVADALARESIKRGFSLSDFSFSLAAGEGMRRQQDAERLRSMFEQGRPTLGPQGGEDVQG